MRPPPRSRSAGLHVKSILLRRSHRAFFAVAIVLMTTLLLAPPGASVVWPFPGSRHLHIGWLEPTGQPAPHPIVYSHPAKAPVVADRRPTSTRPFLSGGPGLVMPPPFIAPWLLRHAELSWLILAPVLFALRIGHRPAEPPPRTPLVLSSP